VLAERAGLYILAGDGAVRKTTRFHKIDTKTENREQKANCAIFNGEDKYKFKVSILSGGEDEIGCDREVSIT